MHCMNDQDELRLGGSQKKEGERLPRVSFYKGMRLQRARDGATAPVLCISSVGPSVEIGWSPRVWPGPSEWMLLQNLLAAIRDGDITVEPATGMRFDTGTVVLRVVQTYGDKFACDHGQLWGYDGVGDRIRSGAWAILPPEESEKPLEIVNGMRLRRADGLVRTVEPHAAGSSWARLTANGLASLGIGRDQLCSLIRSGQYAIVDAAEPATPAPVAEPDPRVLELEAACVERDQRIAELGAVVDHRDARIKDLERGLAAANAKIEASGKAHAATNGWYIANESALDALAEILDGSDYVEGNEAMNRAARIASNLGGNPTQALWYYRKIRDAILGFKEALRAAEARATAAEQQLADLVALGIDALPAMYPDIVAVVVEHGSAETTCRANHDGTWRNGRLRGTFRGTFREALHAAVLAVGGKLPGDGAGPT